MVGKKKNTKTPNKEGPRILKKGTPEFDKVLASAQLVLCKDNDGSGGTTYVLSEDGTELVEAAATICGVLCGRKPEDEKDVDKMLDIFIGTSNDILELWERILIGHADMDREFLVRTVQRMAQAGKGSIIDVLVGVIGAHSAMEHGGMGGKRRKTTGSGKGELTDEFLDELMQDDAPIKGSA